MFLVVSNSIQDLKFHFRFRFLPYVMSKLYDHRKSLRSIDQTLYACLYIFNFLDAKGTIKKINSSRRML